MKIQGEQLKEFIAEYPDFPKKGILYRDLNPLLSNIAARNSIIGEVKKILIERGIEVIVAPESRGFIWGSLVAGHYGLPFIPIRKSGKLPGKTHQEEYELEYGSDVLQIQKGCLDGYKRILIVDDLLATGGTVSACAKLVLKQGLKALSFYFVVELLGLKGREKLKGISKSIFTSVQYN